MKTVSPEELTAILAKHRRWLDEEEGGERADLSNMDLRFQDLRGARLLSALLAGSDFTGSDLAGADLRNADMSGCDLTDVDASLTDMRGTNLSGARLHGLAGNRQPVTARKSKRCRWTAGTSPTPPPTCRSTANST